MEKTSKTYEPREFDCPACKSPAGESCRGGQYLATGTKRRTVPYHLARKQTANDATLRARWTAAGRKPNGDA